jgi:hypothetical protein
MMSLRRPPSWSRRDDGGRCFSNHGDKQRTNVWAAGRLPMLNAVGSAARAGA